MWSRRAVGVEVWASGNAAIRGFGWVVVGQFFER